MLIYVFKEAVEGKFGVGLDFSVFVVIPLAPENFHSESVLEWILIVMGITTKTKWYCVRAAVLQNIVFCCPPHLKHHAPLHGKCFSWKSTAFFKYIFSADPTTKQLQYGSWSIKVPAVFWKSDDFIWQPPRLQCKIDDLVQEFNENFFL